jgi:tetratricopeptide (TPR) repeat protein/predicted Ser/Thr protein kinase
MECPSREALEQHLRHGEPDDAIGAHVAGCARCQQQLAALRTLPSARAVPTLLPPETKVGRYRILHLLGQGGMGSVYAAHDPELDRTVAVKILGADRLDEPETRARLQREGQALARLSHRNVVAVYDVGTCEHGVFIAMEMIEGETLRQWLTQPRSHATILATFAEAGRGLAAAHGAGLVHRDFKPENVLIGRDGRVCVTDFGLARVIGSTFGPDSDAGPSPLTTPITQHGSVPGTPAYMAPEQLSEGVVDVRTDIFSFCVALWEALAGVRPFVGDNRRQLLAAMVTARMQPGRIATVSRRVRRLLLQGLAVSPEARPESMERVLAVLAPPALRRRWIAAGAVAVTGIVVAVVATRPRSCDGSGFAAVWNATSRAALTRAFAATGVPYAGDSAERVAATLDAYRDRWRDMALSACQSHLRHEQSAELFDLRMQCLDERRSAAGALIELFGHADASAVTHAATAAQSLEPVDRCAQAATLRATEPPPRDPARRARLDRLRKRLDDARALQQIGRFTEALAAIRPLAEEAKSIGYAPLIAETLVLRGWLEFVQLKEFPAVRATLAESAASAIAGHDDRTLAEALVVMVRAHIQNHEPQTLEAGHVWAKLAATWLDRIGADSALRVRLLDAEGELYSGQFRMDEAVATYRRAIDLETKSGNEALLGRSLWALGQTLAAHGKLEEAERTLERSKAALEKTLGPDHPTTGQTIYTLSKLLAVAGPFDRAEAYARRALKIMENALGTDNPRLPLMLYVLGNVLLEEERPDEALPVLQRSLRLRPAGDTMEVALDRTSIASALQQQGKLEEALVALGADVESTSDPAARAQLLGKRAELRLQQKRAAMALADYQAALAAMEKAGDPYEEDFSTVLVGEGSALLAQHAADKALVPLERAVKLTQNVAPRARARAELTLARALVESHGDAARAERIARSAVARLAPLQGLAAREAADAAKWLQATFPSAAP